MSCPRKPATGTASVTTGSTSPAGDAPTLVAGNHLCRQVAEPFGQRRVSRQWRAAPGQAEQRNAPGFAGLCAGFCQRSRDGDCHLAGIGVAL